MVVCRKNDAIEAVCNLMPISENEWSTVEPQMSLHHWVMDFLHDNPSRAYTVVEIATDYQAYSDASLGELSRQIFLVLDSLVWLSDFPNHDYAVERIGYEGTLYYRAANVDDERDGS